MQIALQTIQDWIINNNLDVKWVDDITFTLDKKDYVCISPKEGKIFDHNFCLIINEKENEKILIENYCFVFGGQVYWSPVKEDKVQLNLLKHIGRAKDITGFPYLGVHGGYEICAGSKDYSDWCKKAQFLGLGSIGISEHHTLAGVLKFQQAASKAGLRSIIGETLRVKVGDEEYRVKLYVKNQQGWENLLRIHKRLNVDNLSTSVELDFIRFNCDGLYMVLQADTLITDGLIKALSPTEEMAEYGPVTVGVFEGIYYQFDPVVYAAQNRDAQCLECLKNYLNKYQNELPLCLICDSYYLDQEDNRVKKILSFIGKGSFEYQSPDQYFKSLDDVVKQTVEMFATKGEEFALDIVEKSLTGLQEIVDGCDFKINTKELHLPKYELTEEEKKEFDNSEDLFWSIVEEGLNKKKEEGKDMDQYYERVAIETDLIVGGNFIDYFLILRDIVNWAEANDIMVGTGRGSVGGCLCAQFCNLTKIDAVEYGLIFERFLNKSRLGTKITKDIFVIETDTKDIELDFDSKISIFVNGEIKQIDVSELREGDEIISIK